MDLVGILVRRAVEGRRGILEVVFLEGRGGGVSAVDVPGLSDDFPVTVFPGWVGLDVPGWWGKSVWAAVWEGRRLKYPNRDFEAMPSASAMYFSLSLSVLFIFPKIEYHLLSAFIQKLFFKSSSSHHQTESRSLGQGLLVEGKTSPHLEHRRGVVVGVDGVQLYLAGNRTTSSAVGFGVGVGLVQGHIFPCCCVDQPHLVLVVQVFPLSPITTLDLPVDFVIDSIGRHSVHHRQQLGSQPELGFLYPQEVADDGTR